jgi:hypothetical protein
MMHYVVDPVDAVVCFARRLAKSQQATVASRMLDEPNQNNYFSLTTYFGLMSGVEKVSSFENYVR